MFKINKNKIIAIFFLILTFILVFLSLQKVDNKSGEVNVLEIEDSKSTSKISENIIENSLQNESKVNPVVKDFLFFNLKILDQEIQLNFIEGENLYEAMVDASENGKLKFESKNFSDLGAYIYSINGISENRKEKKYWIYYVNGEKANVGVSNYVLKDGDQITWKLENNQY